MKNLSAVLLPFILLACSQPGQAQLWAPILESSRAIDWSQSGVGGIPLRTTICATLTSAASLAEMNAALGSCPRGQTVFLAAGTYQIPGTIRIPSNVTLRGAGADRTILNATGTGENVIAMGSGKVPYNPVKIVSGATAGSTSILVEDARRIAPGKYLVIAELNNPAFVSVAGSKANCDWCDGWTKTGSMARGQIVEVKDVRGDRVTISPALYSAYTLSPVAVPFEMAAKHAGVEDLQVYANNTGYAASFGMLQCAYCWIKGVETNYSDSDPAEVFWGFRDEVRDSYFSNSFTHQPGEHDSGIHVAYKTSASLFENNIVERARVSFDLGWGEAGNVFAYNYTQGEFVTADPGVLVGGFRFHGAHAQFNLFEGNIVTTIDEDSIWGSTSHITAFRNWVTGTNRVCAPLSGRGAVNCTGSNAHYAFQAARAIQISYLASLNSFVGNLVGSAQMQSLTGHNRVLPQIASVEYPAPRSYEGAVYGWSFGYGPLEDRGTGTGTGCGASVPPCHAAGAYSTNFFHGNYNHIDGSIGWAPGVSHKLPPSFYLAAKPGWWGSLPFPAIGPEITGGSGPAGHSFGNPAQICYQIVMGGSDGGQGSPLVFNATRCYGGRR